MTYHLRAVDQARPDVVWNATTQIWHCCGIDGNGNPDCEDPTNETFAAPAPASLVAYFTITSGFVATSTSIAGSSTPSAASSTSASAPSTSASAASTSVPALSSSTAHAGSSPSISRGAAAGIGVGGAVAVIIIIGGLVAYILHSLKRKRRHHVEATTMSMEAPTRIHEMEAGKVEDPMGVHEIGPGR